MVRESVGAGSTAPYWRTQVSARGQVSRLFEVLNTTFGPIQILDQFRNSRRYVLSFQTSVGAEPIHIVDIVHFDSRSHIDQFVVTARPQAGTQALAAAIAAHLAAIEQASP